MLSLIKSDLIQLIWIYYLNPLSNTFFFLFFFCFDAYEYTQILKASSDQRFLVQQNRFRKLHRKAATVWMILLKLNNYKRLVCPLSFEKTCISTLVLTLPYPTASPVYVLSVAVFVFFFYYQVQRLIIQKPQQNHCCGHTFHRHANKK